MNKWDDKEKVGVANGNAENDAVEIIKQDDMNQQNPEQDFINLENGEDASFQEEETFKKTETDEMIRKPSHFYPWRRLLARGFDGLIYGLLFLVIKGSFFYMFIPPQNRWMSIVESIFMLGIMLLIEPLLLSKFATTPGKLIFGIRVKNENGNLLTYKEGFNRTWEVIRYGYGFGIPLYEYWCLWKSYVTYKDGIELNWDYKISYSFKDVKFYRALVYIVSVTALLALVFGYGFVQTIPPYKGNLTVEKYAKNYNYLIKKSELQYASETLDKDGKWIFPSSGYISQSKKEQPIPELKFEIEDGYVVGVSFERHFDQQEEWIISHKREMQALASALIGAQKEINLLDRIPSNFEYQINGFGNYQFEYGNITVINNVEMQGYEEIVSWIDMLEAKDDAENYFFSQEFSVEKK